MLTGDLSSSYSSILINDTTYQGERGRRKSIPSKAASKDDLSPGVVFRMGDEVHLVTAMVTQDLRSGLGEWNWKIAMQEGARKKVERQRPRSFSLGDRIGQAVGNNGLPNMEESDSEDEESPNSFSQSQPKRRSSISGTSVDKSLHGYSGSLAHLVPNSFLQTTSRRVSTHGAAPGCCCSSCGSTMTPYWRDGWATDVMLCNACGLRFQKFARRCPSCMYIPRKEDSLGEKCVKCDTPWVVGP